MNLPASYSELDLAWLKTHMTMPEGCSPGDLTSFSVEPIDDGMGQLSSRGVLHVSMKGSRSARYFVKLRAAAEGSHNYAVSHHLYELEYLFYSQIGPLEGVCTPHAYCAEYDPDQQTSCLILEYLEHAQPVDQIRGANRDELHRAIRALANLSAAFWDDINPISVLPTVESEHLANADQDMLFFREEFIKRYGHALSTDRLRIIDRAIEAYKSLNQATKACPQTLCHWDFRVENLMFSTKTDDVYVVDWQSVMVHSPGWDLAYLLSTNVAQKDLVAWFEGAVDLYLGCLAERGIVISRADLIHQIRVCLLIILQIPIVTGAQIDLGQRRSRQLASCILDRLMFAIEWMNCPDLLS